MLRAALICSLLATSSLTFADDGWVSLFDGKSTKGWHDYNTGEAVGSDWAIEDGTLVLMKKGGGHMTTDGTWSDFDFRFEWKISEGGNSGVIYLSRPGDKASHMSGPEYQILDDDSHRDGKSPSTSSGSLYAMIAAKGKKLNPAGEWNSGRIVKKGTHLEHWVNGKKVVETTMHDDNWNKMVADSKFSKWEQFGKTAKGHIVLQDHGNKVWFRNLKIKDLSK